jgi:two-component system phosphate regulon sensor histidine kinase PhoR
MPFITYLLSSNPYYDFPPDLIGWSGAVLFLLALVVLAVKNPIRPRIKASSWGFFVILIVSAVIFALFFGFRFPTADSAVPFAFPSVYHSSAVMVFALIPAALCAGFFSPPLAMIPAAAAGAVIGLLDTHSIFTIFEYAGMGFVLSWLFQQRYRSSVFEFLQHPLAAASAVALLFIPVTMLGSFLSSGGETAVRIDFALTQSWPVIIAHCIELLIAGFFAELIYLSGVKRWAPGKISGWLPWETSLSKKFMAGLVPIFIASLIVVLAGCWLTAGVAARELLENRLDNLSDIAAESFPLFLDTGQHLLNGYASPNLASGDADDISGRLSAVIDTVPFYTNLRVIAPDGKLMAADRAESAFEVLPEELYVLRVLQEGITLQPVVIPSQAGEKSAEIIFCAPISDAKGGFQGVLLGYTNLQFNPFTKTALKAINTVEQSGGEGWVLDQESRVIYHSNPDYVMTRLFGSFSSGDRFYEQANPGEAPSYIFHQQDSGRPWSVALSVPGAQVQQTALDIAVPMVISIVFLTLVVGFFNQRLLSQPTQRLHLLAEQAGQISKGQLDRPFNIDSQPDEVGQLALAFEQMRRGMKTRLKDINALLKVSQSAAYHADPRRAVLPVLEAFIGRSASCARVIFLDNENMDNASPRVTYTYGIGHRSVYYEDLDEAALELLAGQPNLILPDCAKRNALQEYRHVPGAFMAFRLQRENSTDGVLWAAFDTPQQFTDSDISFFTALAGQAALSVANTNLFRSAEIGRQRMEAVINSSPDPILVFTSGNQLLMMNPAAHEAPQLILHGERGAPVSEVLTNRTLIEMILTSGQCAEATQELTMPGGKTYTATVAEVKSANREVGKICLLRDVSRYKDMDSLKSEFVSTVSHEIQGPLSLMRGYIRMLDLVGETNPQQKNYTQKMNDTIQQINEMVGNILNLRRIETDSGVYLTDVSTLDIVEKVMASMDAKALQKNIQLIIKESTETGITIRTDPVLLQHALQNLVDNGIKYTPNGGRVEIITTCKDGTVVFEVKDNGFGIAPVDVEFIFEEFYRVGQRAAFRQKGTGLGLSIVKTIAERLGGKVGVESQLGKGSSFFIELPTGLEDEEK